MLNKVLVANRGEIALRVIVGAQELEIPAVAVYSNGRRGGPPRAPRQQGIAYWPPALQGRAT